MSISQKLTIGQRLLQERKKHSWSQQMLADKIGTTVLNINRWEHDKTQPQPYYREKLCEVFGKSHDELFGEPQEEERTPLWNIPYLRNLYFTGREEILTRLHDALTTTTKKAVAITQPHAISGLGGIGKTQTAVEYAYRYSNEYKAILWARADSHEALVSDLVSLATVLDLAEKNEADQRKVVAAVLRWFQHAKDWLLIFDNADDLEMASEFLPTRGAGHTLLTTRSQATGKNIKGIEIEKMGRQEGALLLLRRAKIFSEDAILEQASEVQRREAETICEVMDGLPLALDQAAAYIEENECSLSDYLSLYQTRRTTLLKRRGTFSKRDYPKPVAATWSLSFEQVQRDHPAAADLLRLCAFLHPDAIPEKMIVAGASELGPTLHSMAQDPIQLADAIGALRKYSLVRRHPETKTLTIHRLVQVVLKDTMNKETQHEWSEQVVRMINKAFPSPKKVEMWLECQQCLPHAQVCLELVEQWDMTFAEAPALLSKAGKYMQNRGSYIEAESFLRHALTISENALGPSHLDIAHHLNDLAELYWIQDKYDQAEPLYLRALTIREHALDPMHPDVAETTDGLGLLYQYQGKYEQAEQLMLRALSIFEQVRGLRHLSTAVTLNHLGRLYDILGRYKEAERVLLQALTIHEQLQEPDYPNLAINLNDLALLYWSMKKYDQAEPLYRRALSIEEQVYGLNHPGVAATLNNLALLYNDQGKYEEAEPLYQRAIAIWELALGANHAHVASGLSNLATLYRIQGKYDRAEQLYLRALSIREQILGLDHSTVAYSLNGLAKLYCAQGKYEQAEPLYQRALTIREQALGPDHPDVAAVLEAYTEMLHKIGRESEAVRLKARATAIRKKQR